VLVQPVGILMYFEDTFMYPADALACLKDVRMYLSEVLECRKRYAFQNVFQDLPGDRSYPE
jgi:hypothetical protein